MEPLRVIDSDTHVDETEATWEYIPPEEQALKPIPVGDPAPGGKRYWLIDGLRFARPSRDDNLTKTTAVTRELLDVPARLRHMDELGVEVQVIYPTIFLQNMAERPEVELSITRSYNRWIANRTALSTGRLRWIFLPSLRNLETTIEDLRWAKNHGACGVLKKDDREADHNIYEPYFFPLYEEAERLHMPICVHSGSGRSQALVKAVRGDDNPGFSRLGEARVADGIYEIIAGNVPARFPELRFGAIEAGASWLPLIAHKLRRAVARAHLFPNERPQDVSFEGNRLYVTCHVDEDFPMLLRYISEDNLLVGSDYSHQDFSQEINFTSSLQELADQEILSPEAPRKIMHDNAKTFYGL